MADEYVFLASGDACPLCSALNGELVSAGYQPHPACQCQTVPRNEPECEREVEIDFTKQAGGVVAGFEVEVKCPGGGTNGASGSLVETDAYGSDAEFYKDVWDAADELADELCASCPDAEDPLLV